MKKTKLSAHKSMSIKIFCNDEGKMKMFCWGRRHTEVQGIHKKQTCTIRNSSNRSKKLYEMEVVSI